MSEKRLAGMFRLLHRDVAGEGGRGATRLAGRVREAARSAGDGGRADERQEYVVGSHAIRQQSGGAVLGEMLDAWLFGRGLGELAEYDTRVRAVTAEQMRDLARKYFDPKRRVEGIIRGVGRTV